MKYKEIPFNNNEVNNIIEILISKKIKLQSKHNRIKNIRECPKEIVVKKFLSNSSSLF